jgi:mono/diheme cytochrome c family protein
MPNLNHYYKEKLEEIKKQPVKVFALVYPYVLITGLVIRVVYSNNLSQASRATVPAGVPDTTKVTDLKVVEPKVVPPLDIKVAAQPTPDLVSKGEKVFTTVCQSCHGTDGTGKGPGSTGLNPPPRNFTSSQGWKNGPKISQIYKTLQEGIPGSAMVAYDYLLPEEKIALAHYIRQTFTPNPPNDTPDELTAMDQTYQLSQGQVVSAQIPVEAAYRIIGAEGSSQVQKVVKIEGEISADTSAGAKLFKKITGNKTRAIVSLMRDAEWKGNEQKFINLVVKNINQNGFNGRVLNLNKDEWGSLQSYLGKYF